MAKHSLAISRELEVAEIEKKHAEAIAKVVVTHSDESLATKKDIACLDTRISALETKINIVLVLSVVLFIAIFTDRLAG